MKKSFLLLCLCFIYISATAQHVQTGIEQLRSQNFDQLKGKRVGLITNPTGVDSQLKSTVDILFEASEVNLVALFGPEHGVRGNFTAGDKVDNSKDKKTGLPVFSLYGKTRKPTAEMLKGIDILVYDIQDIGSRSYTYISTLGLAMEAAAENNVEVLVLDRPNPLGGKMEGCLVEPGFTSFVSQFAIPYVHGLTCAELAQLLNNTKMLSKGVQCKLSIVPMKGWNRNMVFAQTGLPWVLSSPHIPHASSSHFYPLTGILGELSHINIGVGYTLPFELIGAQWIDNPDRLAAALNALELPGLIFRPINYKPYYSQLKDSLLGGVQIHITDYQTAPLSLVQFYVLQECKKMYPTQNIFEQNKKDRLEMFDKVCGTNKIRLAFTQNFLVSDIKAIWEKDIPEFQEKVKPYLLY